MKKPPLIERIRNQVRKQKAKAWLHAYALQYRILRAATRKGDKILLSLALAVLCVSIYFAPSLKSIFESKLEVASLQTLISGLGSALIGATAIVTSLVLFSMQVNVERMPHGLFRRLGADTKLLGAFITAFILALGVSTLSLVVSDGNKTYVAIASFWAIAATLSLFLYAYRRALVLVNPNVQLHILLLDTANFFRGWANRAERISPLLDVEKRKDSISSHDTARVIFFRKNANWSSNGTRQLRHAISYAQRYSEQGDYEVSLSALNTVVKINELYIAAKGKTFFAENGLIESPFASDQFITDTLEQLRLHVQAGISKKDEQQINQTLRAFTSLVSLYLTIDYSSEYATKSHAYLAAGYLSSIVKELVRREMPDVLMEGLREIGKAAIETLQQSTSTEIVPLCGVITEVSLAGIIDEKNRPATQVGVGQLAEISFRLITCEQHDLGFAVRSVRENILSLATVSLAVPTNSTPALHNSILSDYYSGTSLTSLLQRIYELAGAIMSQPEDSREAKIVISNIGVWADGMHHADGALLLAALKLKSTFTHDIIYWICTICRVLMTLSNAPACEHHSVEKLEKCADRMVNTFLSIPDDIEQLKCAADFNLVINVFRTGMLANQENCRDVAEASLFILVDFAFKAGKHPQLEDCLGHTLILGAALTTSVGLQFLERFKKYMEAHIAGPRPPSRATRERAVREIRDAAIKVKMGAMLSSRLGDEIRDINQDMLEEVLYEVIPVLAP